MKIKKTEIQGCYLIRPKIYEDDRGYFIESFNYQLFLNKTGHLVNFIQDNESHSSKGVIRGLHAQIGRHSQAKLVRVIRGKVLDAVIDIRKNSPSFGKVVTQVLDSENRNQLFIPKGCLHGFSVLEDNTIFSYKCDAYYNKDSEISINPLDPSLNIDWKIEKGKEIISDKDEDAISWSEFIKILNLNAHIENGYSDFIGDSSEDSYSHHLANTSQENSQEPFINSAQGI